MGASDEVRNEQTLRRAHELDSEIDWYGPLWDPNGGVEFYLPAALRTRSPELVCISRRNKPVLLAASQ